MPKLEFALTTLYVENPTASAAFFADLLGHPPVQASPDFVLFALPNGAGIGLWSRHDVTPPAASVAAASELTFRTPEVDAVHADWTARGLTIVQSPTDLPFGRSFVALDPDGHRLRVFTPAAR